MCFTKIEIKQNQLFETYYCMLIESIRGHRSAKTRKMNMTIRQPSKVKFQNYFSYIQCIISLLLVRTLGRNISSVGISIRGVGK